MFRTFVLHLNGIEYQAFVKKPKSGDINIENMFEETWKPQESCIINVPSSVRDRVEQYEVRNYGERDL